MKGRKEFRLKGDAIQREVITNPFINNLMKAHLIHEILGITEPEFMKKPPDHQDMIYLYCRAVNKVQTDQQKEEQRKARLQARRMRK